MMQTRKGLVERINELKRSKNAIILAHNYQRSEVQEIADLVGDSLELIREGLRGAARVIVFCGIRFMAETLKIVVPGRLVLLPRREAGCPMADTVSPEDIIKLRSQRPRATFICHENAHASVKAECDVCCTSSNALRVVNSVDGTEVVFIPDRNLASWVSKHTPKKIIPGEGFCFVHERIDPASIHRVRALHPDAAVLVHPGCRPEVVDLADEVLNITEMVSFSRSASVQKIVVGAEEGIIHRLRRDSPEKTFYTCGAAKMCKNMKITTLEDVCGALEREKYRIELPESIMLKARKPVMRMLEVCGGIE